MTDHTPGPWEAEGLRVWQTKRECQSSQAIARADGSQTEAEANARLIAAAPDLLEASRALVTWLEGLPPEVRDNTPTGLLFVQAQARTAIAKAEKEWRG